MGFGNVLQAGGAIAGAVSGGKGSHSQGMPKFIKNQIKRGYGMLNTAADRPADQAIAGFNPDQLAAMQGIRNLQGFGQADQAAIQGRLNTMAASGVTGDDISRYMNPYTSNVIQASLADLDYSRGQRQAQANAEAEAAGAFGGDRQAVYRANIDGQYDRTAANTIAQLYDQGFNTASGLAMQNYGLQLTGNQQLSALIDARRRAMLGDTTALAATGDAQQQQAQRVLDYPIDMAQMITNAGLGGVGSRPNQTSGGGIGGALSGAAGGLSSMQSILSMFGK